VQLGLRGYACDVVEDGVAALAALETVPYDLLLVDCHMPRMDGYEVAREVRRREVGTARRLPIVAMTADARSDQRQRCLAAGMDDLLSKPIRLETFHAAIERWLARADELPPLDMERMRRAFGSDDKVATVIHAGVGTTRDALRKLPSLLERGDAEEVAGWIHHVLGGVNVFGGFAVGEAGERMELALREGGKVDPVALDAFAADVARFADGLERRAAAMSQS